MTLRFDRSFNSRHWRWRPSMTVPTWVLPTGWTSIPVGFCTASSHGSSINTDNFSGGDSGAEPVSSSTSTSSPLPTRVEARATSPLSRTLPREISFWILLRELQPSRAWSHRSRRLRCFCRTRNRADSGGRERSLPGVRTISPAPCCGAAGLSRCLRAILEYPACRICVFGQT